MSHKSNPTRAIPRTIYFPDGVHTLTVAEVARILGVTDSRVCSMAREGILPCVRLRLNVKGRLYFAEADIAEYQRRTATASPTSVGGNGALP